MTALEKFDRAVSAYLRNLRYKNRSEKTMRNYTNRLSAFRTFWASRYAPETPTADPTFADVEAWRDTLLDGGAKESTAKQYLEELSQFFNVMVKPIHGEELRYAENPVSDEFFPTVKKRPYDLILTDEQVIAVLSNECTVPQQKHFWPRNYAIVLLLLCTKIRNAELLNLRLSDLDFQYGELTVEHGKGDKFRVVEFTELAQSAVKLYLASGLRPSTLPATAPLFGTTAAHAYGEFAETEKWHCGSSQWLSSLVERHIKTVTGVADVRTHDLRHIGSRLALNSGASLEYIQAELGHSSMNTTQLYSGRLLQRRGRKSAAQVLSEMQQQAQRNEAILQAKPKQATSA